MLHEVLFPGCWRTICRAQLQPISAHFHAFQISIIHRGKPTSHFASPSAIIRYQPSSYFLLQTDIIFKSWMRYRIRARLTLRSTRTRTRNRRIVTNAMNVRAIPAIAVVVLDHPVVGRPPNRFLVHVRFSSLLESPVIEFVPLDMCLPRRHGALAAAVSAVQAVGVAPVATRAPASVSGCPVVHF